MDKLGEAEDLKKKAGGVPAVVVDKYTFKSTREHKPHKLKCFNCSSELNTEV